MSAPNFKLKNSSKYFVIDNIEDETDYDMLVEDLQEHFKNVINNDIDVEIYNNIDNNNDRNYPGLQFAEINKELDIDELNGFLVNICFNLVLRSGYYSGVNLDFDYNIVLENEECDNIDYFSDVIDNFFSNNFDEFDEDEDEYILNNRRLEIENNIIEEYKNLVSLIENEYSKLSEEYIKTAQFSNGEAIYEKVNK